MENNNILDSQNVDANLEPAYPAMIKIGGWSSASAVFLSLFLLGMFVIELTLIEEGIRLYKNPNINRIVDLRLELLVAISVGGIALITTLIAVVCLWRSTGGLKQYTYAKDEKVLEKAIDKQLKWWKSFGSILTLGFIGIGLLFSLIVLIFYERYKWESNRNSDMINIRQVGENQEEVTKEKTFNLADENFTKKVMNTL
ncbi:MAG: hypothetical protein MK212_13625 [Saprospiraceae bacterium]|nr:hypothetical protein [Saprospiraceae bacterium]